MQIDATRQFLKTYYTEQKTNITANNNNGLNNQEVSANTTVNTTYRDQDFYEKLDFLLEIYNLILHENDMNSLFRRWQQFTTSEHHAFTEQNGSIDEEDTFDEVLKYFMSSYISTCFDSVQTLMLKIIKTEFKLLNSDVALKTTELDRTVPNQAIVAVQKAIAELSDRILKAKP